jgi:hypothetical protein
VKKNHIKQDEAQPVTTLERLMRHGVDEGFRSIENKKFPTEANKKAKI